MDDPMDRLLDAALAHVPFDGWSEATFFAAAADCGMTREAARIISPRGALDLAVAYHRRGDDALRGMAADLGPMRYSEKVAALVMARIAAAGSKDVVRRGMTLFALPQHAPEAAGLLWKTADRIWTELGDNSDDVNWYTKRLTLSGVYASTLLFWLGDASEGQAATRDFLARRIGDVLQFEKFKSDIRANKMLQPFLAIPGALFGRIRAPRQRAGADMPGHWPPEKG